VVISGGEPHFRRIWKVFWKRSNPWICGKAGYQRDKSHVVENLVQNGLVDYIAMDVKAPFGKYNEICRTNVDVDSIKKSIEIIKSGKVDYEFRTTVAPGLEMDDIFEIARGIEGARLYVLQKYRDVSESAVKDFRNPQFLLDAAVRIKGIVQRVETRGVAFCA